MKDNYELRIMNCEIEMTANVARTSLARIIHEGHE